MAAGIVEVPVVPDAGGKREQALGDAADQAGHGVSAVAFERELALDRVDDRLDPLAHAAKAAQAPRFVLAVRAQEDRAEVAESLCGSFAFASAVVAAGIFRRLWEMTS